MIKASLMRHSSGDLAQLRMDCKWIPPDPQFMKLNCDGAMELESGQAAAAELIRDEKGIFQVGF
ncbi:hypothetical protein Scep_030324 [Stephania cephalantha]|uniref:RNase H type-1 domain-containing protein n=1 Tax=Stephania cephalantha TaxID=152367 RepID=A0AAP0E2M8_9MAGN